MINNRVQNMSVRDLSALVAMHALMTTPDEYASPAALASAAYGMADAMEMEGAKREENNTPTTLQE